MCLCVYIIRYFVILLDVDGGGIGERGCITMSNGRCTCCFSTQFLQLIAQLSGEPDEVDKISSR
jgi:hypothetical protein